MISISLSVKINSANPSLSSSHTSNGVGVAGVGLGNPKGEELPIYLNEEYLIEYNGIQLIETHLN